MAEYYSNFDEKAELRHELEPVDEEAVGPISISLERVEPQNLDGHLNFDEPADEFHDLDLDLKQPTTRIPSTLETFETNDQPPLTHDQVEEVPIEEATNEDRPGVFSMPLTRRERGTEDYLEPSEEDFVPIEETVDNNGDEAEPESLSRKLERMSHENNYPVPYRSKLTEPFEPGQTLIVRGKTVEDSVRFTVSFHNASADFSGNDVPLHISVRFDEGKIVYNTFTKGEWGKEERKSSPWKKGDNIDLRVRAHDNRFTITADQKEIKEYEHRVPLSSVTHFSIDGDIFINHISWSGKYYPVPYESGIPGEGLAPGKTLLIYGTPEKKGKRFHINLLKKNGDIALHFNPRFDEKHIIRNSLISNEWGNEEREGKLPLEKGVGFDLKVVNEEYAFQVFLNDERYCTYAHRLEPHDLNGLQIGGDVEITGIQIF